MNKFLFSSAGILGIVGVLARSLSSHTIKPFLEEREKLDNFNLAADYLLMHAIAILLLLVIRKQYPTAKLERSIYLFLVGSLLFQGTVLIKSCVSISPFGFVTPIGGALLMAGWSYLIIAPFLADRQK